MQREAKSLSVVIPVFNEAEVLPTLYERLVNSTAHLNLELRFFLIDDGSQDETFSVLQQFTRRNRCFVAVKLSRNFGHQQAVTTGLSLCQADVVVIMDGDLQDPPELIATLYKMWQAGNDVVYAVRKKRKENIFKRTAYYLFYRLLHRLSDTEIPVDTGDFCLIDQRVVEVLNTLPERSRFIRGLRSWVGFQQARYEYERDKRMLGSSKYSLSKLMKLAADGILNFSKAPLRLATYAGLMAILAGFAYLFYIAIAWLQGIPIPRGFISLAILIIFFSGVQLFTMGILGAYIGRIFDEVKGRPIAIISDIAGLYPQELPATMNGHPTSSDKPRFIALQPTSHLY